MIIYRPTDKEVIDKPIKLRPRSAFIMTKLGKGRNEIVEEVYNKVADILKQYDYNVIDATTITTGRDFLLKIINMIVGVPLGIVILDKDFSISTVSNCFYEMGWLDALGKETLIIRIPEATIPSDLTRTEYILYDNDFENSFKKYMNNMFKIADYYSEVGALIEKNPLQAIDYYRRAYLITGNSDIKKTAKLVLENDDVNERSKNSVENLLSYFINEEE